MKDLGEPDRAASLYARASGAAWDGGDPARGLEIAKQGIDDLADAPEGPGLADLYHEASRAYFFNSLNDEGTQFGQRALAMAQVAGDLRVQSEALITLGSFSDMPLMESIQMNEQGLEIAHEAGLPNQESRALNNLTHPYSFGLGKHAKAHGYLIRAIELAASTGNTGLELFYRVNSASIAMMLGNLDEAQAALDQAGGILERLDDPGQSGRNYAGTQAVLLRHLGKLEEAAIILVDLVQTCLEAHDANMLYMVALSLSEIAAETGERLESAEHALSMSLEREPHWGGTTWPLCRLSIVHSQLGDLDKARDRLAQAKDILAEMDWAVDYVWVSMAESQLATVEARWDDARAHFQDTVNDLRRFKMRSYLAETLLEWAKATAERGDHPRAMELLEEAESQFREIGAPVYAQIAADRMAELTGSR